MEMTFKEISAYAEKVKAVIGDFVPEVLLILGSGNGLDCDSIENPVFYDYKNFPFVHETSVRGHMSRFVFGKLEGKNVVCMQGRLHYYEGYSMQEIAFLIRICYLLGAKKMLFTNASGSMVEEWQPGTIMVIEDHIKLFSESPVRGENIDEFGPRFFDMSYAYDPDYRKMAFDIAKKQDIDLKSGVYIMYAGPQFETPAEIRAGRILGASAVGMSSVPEVITAAQMGMKVLGFALLTNMAAGLSSGKLSADEVYECSIKAAPKFEKLVRACIREM